MFNAILDLDMENLENTFNKPTLSSFIHSFKDLHLIELQLSLYEKSLMPVAVMEDIFNAFIKTDYSNTSNLTNIDQALQPNYNYFASSEILFHFTDFC